MNATLLDNLQVQSFLTQLATSLDDFRTRNVFADWCFDYGHENLGECLLWMVQNRKRPYYPRTKDGQPSKDCKEFAWFDESKVNSNLGDIESDIPNPVYIKLKGGKVSGNHTTYETVEKAEVAFYLAFILAKQEGWKP